VDFLKINVFSHFGGGGLSLMGIACGSGKTLAGIRRVVSLVMRPVVCIIELPADMSGCPKQRNKKSSDKPVQNVPQYKKDENIHGRQI
jgi:hypothetical protein